MTLKDYFETFGDSLKYEYVCSKEGSHYFVSNKNPIIKCEVKATCSPEHVFQIGVDYSVSDLLECICGLAVYVEGHLHSYYRGEC